MTSLKPYLLLLTALGWAATSSFSQNTIAFPLITNYSKAEFRGGGLTWDMAQDSRGIMYFANNEGLITFDGAHWRTYPLPNKTIIRSLHIDANDRIYVGGQGEIGFFAPSRNGTLAYTSLIDRVPEKFKSFDDIWNIVQQGASVFFRNHDKIFELRNNKIQLHLPISGWAFLGEAGGQAFAQDAHNGLMRYTENKWLPACANNQLGSATITGILPIGSDSFFISTKNQHCFILSNGTLTNYQLPFAMENINSVAKIDSSTITIGSASDGCLSFSFSKGLVQNISHADGLQNNNVNCVFVDREKNIWAGVNNCISFIPYNSPVKYIQPDLRSELIGYSSRIFNGRLYIGTSAGVYATTLNNGSGKDLSFYRKDMHYIKNSGNAETWHLDEVNQQLLASQTAGSAVIREEECLPLTEKSGPGSWLSVPLTSVYPAQNVLTGTFTGLRMLHFDQNKFTGGMALEGIHDSYRYLVIDNNDDIWASHPYRGVYRMRLSPDLKHFDAQLLTDKNGLPSALRNHVFKIKNRAVFATEKGMYEFDAASNQFMRSALLWPLFDSLEMRYLNEDAKGNIWFCSGKKLGVAAIHPTKTGETYSITYFPELTGRILSGFENVYPYNDENIFISSETGIIHLNYKKYVSDRIKLSVLLNNVTAFRGNENELIYGGYNTAPGEQTPALPSEYDAFHFEFSSPVFGSQSTIQYRYQLTGYDTGWSAWSTKKEKDYTNLHHGSYTFRVQAKDNLGNESEIDAYSFAIEAPWYKTWWAKTMYLLAALLVVYLLYRWQKKMMHRQQQKHEAEQKRLQYIFQLEREKNEKEILALQNEKLVNEVLLKKKELANTSMQLAENADALAKIRKQVNRFSGDNLYDIKKIATLLKDVENNNAYWEQFAAHFDEINDGFLKTLKSKYPELSNNDLKMCSYLRLNLSSKEIAQLLNISIRGVEISRYRLRKKLQLQTEQSLNDFLAGIVTSE